MKHTKPLLDKLFIRFKFLRILFAVGTTVLVVYFLLAPETGVERFKWFHFRYADKCVHAILFGSLSFIWYVALGKGSSSRRVSASSVFTFSVLLEIMQIAIPNRSFDVFDIVANGLGIIVVVIILKKIK